MSKSEIETTIVWTADDERATVCSLMPKVWRWCAAVGGEEINLDQGIRDGKKAVRTFLVPVECIRIKRRRKASQAQLDALKAVRAGLNSQKPPSPDESEQ